MDDGVGKKKTEKERIGLTPAVDPDELDGLPLPLNNNPPRPVPGGDYYSRGVFVPGFPQIFM